MKPDIMRQVMQTIDARAQSRPSPIEFELAYQARVAIDRIRFAIKHTEQFAPRTDEMQEAGLQLLDALERLESAERNFQSRCRCRGSGAHSDVIRDTVGSNGHANRFGE